MTELKETLILLKQVNPKDAFSNWCVYSSWFIAPIRSRGGAETLRIVEQKMSMVWINGDVCETVAYSTVGW